jgi:ribonuclease Z
MVGWLPYDLGITELEPSEPLERDAYRIVPGASGDVQPAEVVGDPRPGRKLVIAGDCAAGEATRVAAHGANVLIHEATFGEEESDRARETGHSTAREAATLAAAAEVSLLALTHLSPRYAGPELRDEAREVFANTIVPRDFDRIEIPFAERGDPVHVRADESRRRAAPVPEDS